MGLAIEILALLKRKPRLPAKVLKVELKVGKSTLHNCLVHLKDLQLVKSINHGVFELTPLGQKTLTELENKKQ